MNGSHDMRALLAIADPAQGATLARGLLEQGIDVAIGTNFTDARTRALGERFDALVVDAALPGGGVELWRDLWRRGIDVAVIMLTDTDSLADRVRARDAAADAYLTKPVAVRDLVAQLTATERRRPFDVSSDCVRTADLEIDLRLRTVYRAGRQIDLTRKEFALLEILARSPGQTVSRAAIAAHVWHDDAVARSNLLEVLVRRLRRKIDDGHDTKLVRTLRSSGYQLART
jgi:two-component system copper resistance phosphate regulon response regulator CusR